jgi:hypothetical protein
MKKAVRKSIAHWKRMRSAPKSCGEEPYSQDCALCRKYQSESDCGACPANCKHGSLWENAAWRWADYVLAEPDEDMGALRREWRAAALKEIEYLESLLEEPKTTKGVTNEVD